VNGVLYSTILDMSSRKVSPTRHFCKKK
jgi:hypothetical protein